MNRRLFIYCAATGLMILAVLASVPIPVGFFKPAPATGGPPFGGLEAFWKADSFTPMAYGTLIGGTGLEWIDSSGNGHTATGSGTTRPNYNTDFSGRPVIQFTAAAQSRLTFPAITNLTGDFTFLAVTQGAVAASSMLLSDIAQFHLGFNWGSENKMIMSAGGSPLPSLTFSTASSAARLSVCGRSGTTLKFYENNGVDHSTGTSSATFAGMDTLGSYAGGGFDFSGNVGEVLVYSYCMSQAQIQDLYTNYFKPRWGLP